MAELVTLADVARAAGVSLATASRALSGAAGRTVRADLKAKVLQAAADLNYSPNANAQAMVRGTTTTVGLIVHDIADPFAAAVASGVMAVAAERDLIVTIASTMWDPDTEIRHVEALRRQRARAVILAGSGSPMPRCSSGWPQRSPASPPRADTSRRSGRKRCRSTPSCWRTVAVQGVWPACCGVWAIGRSRSWPVRNHLSPARSG